MISGMSPTFYVPGAQKCGTTYLYWLLKSHPNCFLPDEKEPQALSSPDYARERYLGLFASAANRSAVGARGEASTSYFVVSGVPERIFSEFGSGVRFVFIFREPVERVLSSYLHMFKRGHESRDWSELFGGLPSDIDEAIDLEAASCLEAEASGKMVGAPYRERFGEQGLWPFHYLYGTLYSRHVGRFLRIFGRDNCHFVFLEDMQRDPLAELKGVYQFLGLDADFVPDDLHVVRNRTVVNRPCPPLAARIRSDLHELFADERQRLSRIVGRLPPEWERLPTCVE